jgi:hypothetical protein
VHHHRRRRRRRRRASRLGSCSTSTSTPASPSRRRRPPESSGWRHARELLTRPHPPFVCQAPPRAGTMIVHAVRRPPLPRRQLCTLTIMVVGTVVRAGGGRRSADDPHGWVDVQRWSWSQHRHAWPSCAGATASQPAGQLRPGLCQRWHDDQALRGDLLHASLGLDAQRGGVEACRPAHDAGTGADKDNGIDHNKN